MRNTAELVEDRADTESTQVDKYMTRKEVAERCRVPLSTFDSLRRQARVPFPDAHVGKHMLWRTSTIEAFLDSGGTHGLR